MLEVLTQEVVYWCIGVLPERELYIKLNGIFLCNFDTEEWWWVGWKKGGEGRGMGKNVTVERMKITLALEVWHQF
jgi:hypothetical protein